MRQVPEPHIKNCIFLSGNMLWQMCSLGNSRFTSAVVQMFLYAADPEEQSCACCSVLAGLHRNLGCEAPRAVVAKPGPASEMVLAVMGVQGAVCGLCHTWTSKASPREWLPRAIPVCWKADRSVGASQHLHSSFPGTAAQLGTSVYLCSFKSLGLTLLFYCWSGVVFNTDFFKSHASIWISRGRIRCWQHFGGFKARLVASSAREQSGEETNARARQFHSIEDALLDLLYFMFHF